MVKKISFAVCVSILGLNSSALAQNSNAVINKVGESYTNESSDQQSKQQDDLATAFSKLKAEWQAQQMEDQKRLNASLAENKKLAEKIKTLEARFEQLSNKEESNVSIDAQQGKHFDVKHVKISPAKKTDKSKEQGSYPTTLRSQGGAIAFIGDDSDYGASTMFEAYPTSQVPFYILKNKTHFGDRALVFGGYIEIDGSGFWGDQFTANDNSTQSNTFVSSGNYQNGYNLNVTTANLDVMANINKWIQTYWTFSSMDITTPFIENAFVTFGNLEENPFFLTVGKNRLPMGVWAGGGPWISGITQGYFRPGYFTNAMVGYYEDGFNVNVAAFVPELNVDQGYTNEGNFMISTFYSGKIKDTNFTYGFDAAYLYNFANTGMGANNQEVFSDPTCTPTATVSCPVELQARQDRNSVINVEGNIGYNELALFAGWTGLTFAKDYTNNSLAGAWYIQPTYSPVVFDQVTVFGVSWGQAYNMNDFFFPTAGLASFGISIKGVQKEFVAFIQRPILTPQVLLGIEFGWLGLYNGGYTNEVTVDLSVYF